MRNIQTPYRLTKTEKKILSMVNKGMNTSEIAQEFKVSKVHVIRSKIEAREKEKSQILFELQQDKKGFSSLSKAHGRDRMIGTK